jgi:hypothetical protein
MRLLLHGISRPELPALDQPLVGLRRQPLARIEAASLAAYGTCWSADEPTLGRADLLAHHELLQKLHGPHQACLPARFPSWFRSEDEVRQLLQVRADQLSVALDKITGHVELAVTALWTTHRAEEPSRVEGALSPGRKYLLERQRRYRVSDARRSQARALASAIERGVGEALVDVQHAVCPREGVALSSALLVAISAADKVAAHLREVPPTAPDVRILVGGPWPPYTFAAVQAREA